MDDMLPSAISVQLRKARKINSLKDQSAVQESYLNRVRRRYRSDMSPGNADGEAAQQI